MKKIILIYDSAIVQLQKIQFLPPLLARLVVGYVFIESGWGKLHNLEKVTGFFTQLGLPEPHLQAIFVSSTELTCGLLVFFGLLTRLASIPLIVIMIVAIMTAKRSDINEISDLFALSEFLYILLLGWLVVQGAGCGSLDRLFRKK